MILEGWTMVVTMHCWWSKPKQMRLQKLTTNSVLVKWGWDQWRGCEGARSKVMQGQGRGLGRTGFEGSEETERSWRRYVQKKVGENLPSFFFIFRRWQVALSAICQLLNIKKIPSIIFQRASFQRGGYLSVYRNEYETMTLLADKIFVLLYIKLIKY